GADVVAILEQIGRQVGFLKTIPVGRNRVCLARPRPLGLPAWRPAGLLSYWQSDRQCLHRAIRWQVPGGMLEGPIGSGPWTSAVKVRLGRDLQQGATPWRDRREPANRARHRSVP